jgi:hypothetical protein
MMKTTITPCPVPDIGKYLPAVYPDRGNPPAELVWR